MDYSAAFLDQNDVFAELIRAADASAPVPTCPGWTITQLFRHVGRGDRWAAQIVSERSQEVIDPRTVSGGKPADDADIAHWLREGAQGLIDAVRRVGEDTPVWTFLGPRPSSWWIRRRLHEATVHRADAAVALGLGYQIAPDLAADGISEWLDRVVIQAGSNGSPLPLDPGQTLHLHAGDPGLGPAGEWTVSASADGLRWAHQHGKSTAALRGGAAGLLLAILRRQSVAEAGVEILGDAAVWDAWLASTPF
jgi:uncharacterized protein (TIGR03083 family)